MLLVYRNAAEYEIANMEHNFLFEKEYGICTYMYMYVIEHPMSNMEMYPQGVRPHNPMPPAIAFHV